MRTVLSGILKYFKIHDLSIKTQLIILIVVTAAPFFAACIFIHRYTVNSMVEKLSDNHLGMMERAAADVDTLLYDIEALVNFLSRDRSLRSMLSADYHEGNYNDFLAVSRCHDMIESQVILNDNIVSVYVISMHHRIKCILSKVAFLNAEYVENYEWYREMDKASGSIRWIPARQNEDNNFLKEFVITCVSPVINPNTGNTLGHVSVTVREGCFDSILGENRPAPCGTIFLTDQDGRLFYSSEKVYLNDLTTNIADSITNKTDVPLNKTSNPSGFYYAGRGKNRQLVTFNTVPGHQWKIVSTVPLSWVTGELNRLEVIIYSVMLLCMVLTLFLAGIFYRDITGPVDTLKKLMENVGSGDFSVNGRQINSRNEIKKIYGNFGKMTESISRLIKRNTDMMEQKRIAELKALQAQINPHFLYNTLDAVNWLAKMKNQDDISKMITNLSRFFRNILNNGRDVVTIEEELNHSRAYIEIERFRYKNRFEVSFNLDIRLLKCLTLKLILQPLIENALVHGFKESNCCGRIVVQLFSVGDTVCFEVIDNGQGMDQACIDAVLTEKKEGYGLANVDERIKLQYGEQYGVSIISKKGEGTVVTIKIPRVEQDVDIEEVKPDEGDIPEVK